MFCTDELQDARTDEGGGESNQSISPSGYPEPPRGEAERDAESILITPLHRPTHPPGLGRSFIDRAGWFAEQVSGLENGPFSRHIGSRRREREERTRGTHGTRDDGKRRVEYDSA